MSYLIFNGVPSIAFNVRIIQPPDYKAAERPYASQAIAGRNGSILINTGSYQNVELTYSMSMVVTDEYSDFKSAASAIATWLNPSETGNNGYFKLIESEDPTHFRWARFKGDFSITNAYNQAGTFDITFDCMPQRFLVDGESVLTMSSSLTSRTIHNNTSQIARPFIYIASMTTAGNITIQGTDFDGNPYGCRIRCNTRLEDAVLNCYEEDCYRGGSVKLKTGENLNTYLILESLYNTGSYTDWVNSYDFPVFYPGTSTVTKSNTTEVQIVTNSWDL